MASLCYNPTDEQWPKRESEPDVVLQGCASSQSSRVPCLRIIAMRSPLPPLIARTVARPGSYCNETKIQGCMNNDVFVLKSLALRGGCTATYLALKVGKTT
jgi:hypothetical protein